jgi:pilus assembly protein Flp/PilA
MRQEVSKFFKDDDGLTMVEYAIAGGLVGAGAIIAFRTLGQQVTRIIDAIWGALSNVTIQS